jgi:hypothetical protein
MKQRTWMIEKRESMGLSREQMAERCNPRNKQTGAYLHPGQVSEKLIEMLEEDDTCVTHPSIVKRIAKVYGMSKDERLTLLPENHRPGPNYDPDRYKAGTDYRFFVAEEDK